MEVEDAEQPRSVVASVHSNDNGRCYLGAVPGPDERGNADDGALGSDGSGQAAGDQRPGSAAQHVRHRHGRGPLIFRADEDTITSKELATAYKAGVGGEGARRVGREGGYFNLEREPAPANAGKGMATHHGADPPPAAMR